GSSGCDGRPRSRPCGACGCRGGPGPPRPSPRAGAPPRRCRPRGPGSPRPSDRPAPAGRWPARHRPPVPVVAWAWREGPRRTAPSALADRIAFGTGAVQVVSRGSGGGPEGVPRPGPYLPRPLGGLAEQTQVGGQGRVEAQVQAARRVGEGQVGGVEGVAGQPEAFPGLGLEAPLAEP